MTFITFVSKWIHLFSIVGVLGTVICMRFVVLPALQGEQNESGERMFRAAGRISALFWLLIILTGLFNTYRVSADVNKAYHMALGGKIALALLMLGLSALLSHPSRNPEGGRQNRAQLLSIILLLGVLILGLSAHLNISRITGTGLEKPAPTAPISL